MLKLERKKPKSDITIALQSRDSVFSKTFVFAFLFALAIHLIPLLSFKIQLKNPDDTEYPPTIKTSAIADIETKELLSPNIGKDDLLPYFITAPEENYPTLPFPASYDNRQKQIDCMENSPWHARDFQQVEHVSRDHLNLVLPVHYSPLKVAISGKLAEYTVDFLEEKIKRKFTTKTFKVTFDVLAEGRPGKVFWFEKENSSGQEKLDKDGEEVLKKISFDSREKLPITKGKIEVIFEIEEGKI